MGQFEKKKEIIDGCLATFMKNGLTHTSTKDLCDALNLNSGGVFYYFKTRDEIVIACAEEAKKRIEIDLFGIAINDIENPEKLAKDLHERAVEMRPLMKFFVSVCATPKYEESVHPLLDALGGRYKCYTEQFANKLGVTPEEIAPYVYIVINTMLSYMLFGKANFVAPQLTLVYNKLVGVLEKRSKQNQNCKTDMEQR